MRFLLCLLMATLIVTAASPAFASCPGTAGCTPNVGCPAGAVVLPAGGSSASIQAAINSASSGDKICVPPGTYTGKIDFQGKAVTLLSSAGPVPTILDGGGTGPVVTFNTYEGADSVLDGFTVTNGNAKNGGGILIQSASPTIRNSIVRGNVATGDPYSRGGGIWVTGVNARPSILCTQILANRASYSGGGLTTSYFADPYLRSTHFEGNSAAYGGAIAAQWNGRLDLGKTCILANSAGTDGGGIHAGTPFGNVLVRQVCFKGNKAASNGGGMWVPAGLAEVLNSTFLGNKAARGGGVAAGHGSMVDVANSLFLNNTTTSAGSAALVKVNTMVGTNTSVVNHYNGFSGNTGGNFLNTYGNLGLLPALPSFNGCCPTGSYPSVNAGSPDLHFKDINGTRNDLGACGGPVIF